jgi:hypothetical protein
MTPPHEDLPDRRRAWDALSDLFLDTDVSLLRDGRVRSLSALPYTIGELEQILADEVFPVCKYNLISVAGVWSGFNGDWLERAILRRQRWPFSALRRIGFGRSFVAHCDEWQATKACIEALRQVRSAHAA